MACMAWIATQTARISNFGSSPEYGNLPKTRNVCEPGARSTLQVTELCSLSCLRQYLIR